MLASKQFWMNHYNKNNNNNNLRNELDSASQSPKRSSLSPAVQQSPVSISVTNSELNSNTATPALSDIPAMPIMDHSEVNDTTPYFANSNIQGTNTVTKSDSIVPNSDIMDVDHEEPGEKLTTADIEDPEQSRLQILDEIDAKLDLMEDTRLEMVPLLLDIVEQVKTGEISIKDVDNVCGRIRLRLNKLREDRSVVKSELENINSQFRCSADQNESTKQRIAIKERCLDNIIKSIDSYKENKTNPLN